MKLSRLTRPPGVLLTHSHSSRIGSQTSADEASRRQARYPATSVAAVAHAAASVVSPPSIPNLLALSRSDLQRLIVVVVVNVTW